MKIRWFVHAVASCWNNGNAHFLRGLGVALREMGHDVLFLEPENSWSESNLLQSHGRHALDSFRATFPGLNIDKYDLQSADLAELTDNADLVVVHEWNEPALVNALGTMRACGAPFLLLFQDTHHRAASNPDEMARFNLSGYDGALVFGASIAEIYRSRGWAGRVWTLHEAADSTTFFPRPLAPDSDCVWIGNWGDDERSAELREFLIDPISALGFSARIYGVRYPDAVQEELAGRGICFGGWLANHEAPIAFARARFTVHVPRRLYAEILPGVPTIRVFEALACGIPLISSPWDDSERLFPPGCYLTARNGGEMQKLMRAVVADADLRESLIDRGLAAVRSHHTCRHRARELLAIADELRPVKEAA
ncbi:MAG TPA: glycosyltransferase [Rhizomicrobium sp.]|jgi:spore maturation protein CgeB|nr:glycosyltransferase [Rhizomicrobium sp.]